ncbi:MAG TPA: DUF5996 family protein [Candidatus Acidoferrales bacterium]|nr:DUF5996 family protein [Candidatus Acidoferrales bacterium]
MSVRPQTRGLADYQPWPALPLADWAETRDTLHMWTQIVGKLRLALSPRVNHWWEVPFYVTPRGLTTSAIPYLRGLFEAEFDFLAHVLRFTTSFGEIRTIALAPRTVADFYAEFRGTLATLGIDARIWPMPVEIANPIRFDLDTQNSSYDAEQAHRFWQVLVSVDTVLKEFRASFIGKASPVHFFWGSFDLAVTRFSGRRAPERPNADAVTREAYSHEVSSAGWWPGGGEITSAMFYAYAAPEPAGFRDALVRPAVASYHSQLGEFLLPYDEVRGASNPRSTLMEFLESTYEAAARLGHWDRAALERQP